MWGEEGGGWEGRDGGIARCVLEEVRGSKEEEDGMDRGGLGGREKVKAQEGQIMRGREAVKITGSDCSKILLGALQGSSELCVYMCYGSSSTLCPIRRAQSYLCTMVAVVPSVLSGQLTHTTVHSTPHCTVHGLTACDLICTGNPILRSCDCIEVIREVISSCSEVLAIRGVLQYQYWVLHLCRTSYTVLCFPQGHILDC